MYSHSSPPHLAEYICAALVGTCSTDPLRYISRSTVDAASSAT